MVVKHAEQEDEEEQRTSIHIAMNPFEFLNELNQQKEGKAGRRRKVDLVNSMASLAGSPVVGRKRKKAFSHQIISVIGPCPTKEQAQIVEALWNFKSRAVAPRMVLASVIASQFRLRSWHDVSNMFPLRYFSLEQHGDTAFLRLKRTKRS